MFYLLKPKNSDLRCVVFEKTKKIKLMGQIFPTDFFEGCRQRGRVERGVRRGAGGLGIDTPFFETS